MKMIYHRRDNNRLFKKTAVYVSIVMSVVAVVVILSIFSPNFLSPAMQTVGKPFFFVRNAFDDVFGGTISVFKSKSSLENENLNLKEQLVKLKSVETERDYYKSELDKLSQILAKIENPKKYILGNILSKPGFSPYDTMIIDIGKNDAVKTGDFVFADENIIIGVISVLNNHTSTVRLFSSPEEKIEVFVGASQIESLATGKGGGTFEIKLPKNTGVKVGDFVTMASSTKKIFGTVEYLRSDPSDSFETALFKSPVDVTLIGNVLVEKTF